MTLPDSFPQFSVKPYANIPQAKRGRFDPADDCCICGKRLTRKLGGTNAVGFAYIAGGGSSWAKTGDGPENGDWMGWAGIGSECWKRHYTHSVPRKAVA